MHLTWRHLVSKRIHLRQRRPSHLAWAIRCILACKTLLGEMQSHGVCELVLLCVISNNIDNKYIKSRELSKDRFEVATLNSFVTRKRKEIWLRVFCPTTNGLSPILPVSILEYLYRNQECLIAVIWERRTSPLGLWSCLTPSLETIPSKVDLSED